MRHHLAESLEAADFDLGVGVKFLLQNLVAVLFVARIKDLAAVAQSVERRDGENWPILIPYAEDDGAAPSG